MARHTQVVLPVLLIAAYLWGLDAPDSGSQIPVARGILNDLNAPTPLVDEVCEVIGRRNGNHAGAAAAEYELLLEADRRAGLEAAGKTG